MEEPITIYKSEDGKETPIMEMNNFHLVNAILKVHYNQALPIECQGNPTEEGKALLTALKAELFNRLKKEDI